MDQANNPLPVSIVIPTYGRNQVLIDTINSLLKLDSAALEIIIIDQSKSHEKVCADQLAKWHQENTIKLLRLDQPSIPIAMNTGLSQARYSVVLFLDDDIKAHGDLVSAHFHAHQREVDPIIAGKVIQPWDNVERFSDHGHQFNSDEEKYIDHFMGGNFSINKSKAIAIGGFDENFIDVAYRFEKEFADRWLNAGEKILFIPQACIDHLKVSSGGTREFGEHLTTYKPHHAVGAYYYLMVSPTIKDKCAQILKRLTFSVKTRHHLHKPWYIPITLIAELRGILQAIKLKKSGPRYLHARRETS